MKSIKIQTIIDEWEKGQTKSCSIYKLIGYSKNKYFHHSENFTNQIKIFLFSFTLYKLEKKFNENVFNYFFNFIILNSGLLIRIISFDK